MDDDATRPRAARFVPAERAALALAALLLTAAVVVPRAWRALDPALHARWWYVHGGPVDDMSGLSEHLRSFSPTPLPDRPWYARSPFMVDRWLELHGGCDADGGRPCASVSCIGFDPPGRDPWGHAWVQRAPSRIAAWRSPGHVLFHDSNGGEDPRPYASGLVWSAGPDGIWEGGRGDDILLDGPVLDAALMASGPELLALLAAALGLVVVLARRIRPDLSRGREALAILAITALAATPLVAIADGWHELVPLSGETLRIPARAALDGSVALLVVLGVTGLRLARRP